MEPQECPPPLVAFDPNQALQCAEYVEFLSEDSRSCDALDLGKRNRGVVEPQASRKKEKRDSGIFLKDVMVASDPRISCGQHVQFQLLLDSMEFKGKFSLKTLPPKEEERYSGGRQCMLYAIVPEIPTIQKFFLGIELWFKQFKDSTESRIDDFCAGCKVSKKGTKKKLLCVRDEKISGTFGEKLLLDVQINEQCSHYVEKFGGPAKSEFFLHTTIYVEDQRLLNPLHKKMSTGILVIAAGKADSTKKTEKATQAAKFMKEIVFKFEESLKQIHYKVDLMDQRLQHVEASLQSILIFPKVEPTDSKQPSPPQVPLQSTCLTSSSEFKFQKFGTTTSTSTTTMSLSAVQSPVFVFPQNENSNAAFVGGEQLISENSFAAQVFHSENSKSIVKPDPDQHINSSNQGGWSEYFGPHSSFTNPSL